MVTAPKSGAEIIPFLKTYVNLPGAIAFTVLYGSLSNRFSQPQVFRGLSDVSGVLRMFCVGPLSKYRVTTSAWAGRCCSKNTPRLPFQAADSSNKKLTFSFFYLAAALWGSVVASLLFWGLRIPYCTASRGAAAPSRHRRASSPGMMEVGGLFFDVEAVRTESRDRGRRPATSDAVDARLNHAGRLRQRGQGFAYLLFGLFANVALVFSGQFVRIVSKLRAVADPAAAWGLSLKLLMGGVVASGGVLLGAYEYMQRQVVTDPRCVDPSTLKKSKRRRRCR